MTMFQFIVAALVFGITSGTVQGAFKFVKEFKVAEMTLECKKWKLKALHWEEQYEHILVRWNALAKKINSLGGEQFLNAGKPSLPGFTPKELKQLVALCHPDKHAGSEVAQTITRKLLEMRK